MCLALNIGRVRERERTLRYHIIFRIFWCCLKLILADGPLKVFVGVFDYNGPILSGGTNQFV